MNEKLDALDKALVARATATTKRHNPSAYWLSNLLYDKGMTPIFCLIYAYFRWLDDYIDEPNTESFVCRQMVANQKELLVGAYCNPRMSVSSTPEAMIVSVIDYDKSRGMLLKTSIMDMIAALEWDTYRRGKVVSSKELAQYSWWLGRSYTKALQAFIAYPYKYPDHEYRYYAGVGAHITHIMRDFYEDLSLGYINISKEDIRHYSIDIRCPIALSLREWAQKTVITARKYINWGKLYLSTLPIFRCRLMGYIYCSRYEMVLDVIEDADFDLSMNRFESVRKGKYYWQAISNALTSPMIRGQLRVV